MATDRCAAHPGRPAVDRCPVCALPRCGADQASWQSGGCTRCLGGVQERSVAYPPAGHRELVVRAGLAAGAAAVAWGYVTAEYVGADVFKYLSPGVLGVLCAGAATAAAQNPLKGQLSKAVRWLSVVYAVLGSGVGFLLEGTYDPVDGSSNVLVPYAIAAAAAWFWAAPPVKRKAKQEEP